MSIHATTGDRDTAARAANTAASQLIARTQESADAATRAIEASFRKRAEALESGIAQAEVELEALRLAPPSASGRKRELELRESIGGQRVSLTALRNDFESKRSAQEARTSAVSLTADAPRPSQPVNRNVKLALALGLALGLLGGAVLAFGAENLARRFRSRAEIEDSVDAPVLAAIPRVRRSAARSVFNSGSEVEEAFRRLRTSLLLPLQGQLPRVLVTSAEPGEGKSTVVANLGHSIAESGRSVLLLDADLRAPTLHKLFGLPNEKGLGDLLSSASDGAAGSGVELIRPTGQPNLFLLPAGRQVEDAATLLESSAMSRLFEELEQRFEVVIVDSPAVLAVSDALVMARYMDEVLLVVGSHIPPASLRLANQELTRIGASPLGVVVNSAEDPGLYRYIDYYAARRPHHAAMGPRG
jgi:capsular exopolysaccharide synthesis family protein